MRGLTGKQTLRVHKTLAARYSREVTLSWSRSEFNAKLAEIATELYGVK